MRTLEMTYIWCHQVSPKITGLPPKLRIGFAPSSCPHFASREVAPGDLAPQLNGTSSPWRLLSWNPFNERRFQQILRAYNTAPTSHEVIPSMSKWNLSKTKITKTSANFGSKLGFVKVRCELRIGQGRIATLRPSKIFLQLGLGDSPSDGLDC